MTLIEVVDALESLNEESTIYASEPWTDSSTAVVARESESGRSPDAAQELGLTYFLEVFIARQFLEGWTAHLDAEPTLQEKCARLIEYAINDA